MYLLRNWPKRNDIHSIARDELKKQPSIPCLLQKPENLVPIFVIRQVRHLWETDGYERSPRVRSFVVLNTRAKPVGDSYTTTRRKPRQRLRNLVDFHEAG